MPKMSKKKIKSLKHGAFLKPGAFVKPEDVRRNHDKYCEYGKPRVGAEHVKKIKDLCANHMLDAMERMTPEEASQSCTVLYHKKALETEGKITELCAEFKDTYVDTQAPFDLNDSVQTKLEMDMPLRFCKFLQEDGGRDDRQPMCSALQYDDVKNDTFFCKTKRMTVPKGIQV